MAIHRQEMGLHFDSPPKYLEGGSSTHLTLEKRRLKNIKNGANVNLFWSNTVSNLSLQPSSYLLHTAQE
jgi:hypothetical protein